MLGSVQSVLVESLSSRSAEEVSGKTSNNRTVNFAGGDSLIGRFVDVRISEARRHTLRGEIVNTADMTQ